MPACIQACPPMFPTLANRGYCGDRCDVNPDILRMRCDPFVRLVNVPTKSFMVKRCNNPCAPKDSLDIALNGCYDHHRQWWAPKSQTIHQCETYRLYPWGRCQTRMCRLRCCSDDPCCACDLPESCNQQAICVNHEPYKNNSSHMNANIGPCHISSSNRGYGRSASGCFYNC